MERIHLTSLIAVIIIGACDGPTTPADADFDASSADAASGDSGPVCAREADCDDGLFCNGAERCEPGNATAAANGCVHGSSPCGTGESCEEDSDACLTSACPSDPAMRDRDGDGHQPIACPGGDDCDDADGNRYFGEQEICDVDDEDCVESTVGDTDADGDGYVSAACCNGATCGQDCNDANASVHPGVAELCNAADDDCDGVVDPAGSFCPVGTCVDQRCRAIGWERVYGTSLTESTLGLSIDADGTPTRSYVWGLRWTSTMTDLRTPPALTWSH